MDLHTEDREKMEAFALNIKLHSRDGISGTVYCWKCLCGWRLGKRKCVPMIMLRDLSIANTY